MNTPETDFKSTGIAGFYSCETVPASFARKLEIERNEARALVVEWKSVAQKMVGLTGEIIATEKGLNLL